MIHNNFRNRLLSSLMAVVILPWSSFVYDGKSISGKAYSKNYKQEAVYRDSSDEGQSTDYDEIYSDADTTATTAEVPGDSDNSADGARINIDNNASSALGIEEKTGYKLTKDETYDAGFMLTDGVLDLDGHTLTVNGDFIQTAGEIQINGGTLIITGDYRQQSIYDADGNKEYEDAAAKLIMSDEKDKVIISGSVYIGSNISDGNNLKAGELRVGKNLIITTANDKCFDCVDDFVLTFYAEKEHYISFTNDSENGIKAKDRMLMVNNLKVEEDTHNSTNEHGIINSNNETANNTNELQNNDVETDIKSDSDEKDESSDNEYQPEVNTAEQTAENRIIIRGNALNITGSLDAYENTVFYSELYIGEADLAKDGSNYEVAIVNGIIDAYPQINCRLTRRKSGIKQHNVQNPDVNYSEEADYSKDNQSEEKNSGEKNSEENDSTVNSEKIIITGNVEGKLYDVKDIEIKKYASLRWLSFAENGNLAVEHWLGLYSDDDHGYTVNEGKIYVKEAFEVDDSVFFSENCHIVMNGDEYQEIVCRNKLGILEIDNHSEAGVCSVRLPNYHTLIDNGCRYYYFGGDITYGMTLEEDMTYKGSLNLVDGILDLNGHTLTVGKNFIQHSGTLKINGGKLIVGSFTEMAEITGKPGDVIVMENDKDTIIVENKFEMQYSAFPEISKGEIIIKGNLNINTNNIKDGIQRLPGNVTFVIAGDKPQKLYDQNVILPNIRFENTDVATLSEVMVAGKVTDETDKTGGRITGNLLIDNLSQLEDGFFGGSIKLQENSVLNGNVTVKGSLSVGKNAGINLNGYSLTAGGMVLDYGSRFIMNKKSDRLTVNGDLTVCGVDIYDTGKRVITNGQIEVYGNLTSKAIYGFTASGEHKVIVSSKNPDGSIEKRQINFDSTNTSKAKLKKLILRGIEEDFTFNISKEKVAEEIIYDYTIRDYLAVEGLHAEDVTESTVTLRFTDPNSVNNDEPEYYNEYKFKIFRDGVPVTVTKDTTFTDKNLTPETSYEYSVIVFDRYGNTSPSSGSIKVTTTEDTTPPTAPQNLAVTGRTGSSIMLGWEQSSDRRGVTGYQIYRDDELIASDVKTASYKDTGLEKDRTYEYTVRAVDASGITSEESEAVTASVAMPFISRIVPDNAVFGRSSIKFNVFFNDYGSDVNNELNIYLFDEAGSKWIQLNDKRIETEKTKIGEKRAEFIWNTEKLYDEASGSFKQANVQIRFILSDEDGNECTFDNNYSLDGTAPAAPENIQAVDENGIIKVTWDNSTEADFAYYKVWRAIVNGDDSANQNDNNGTQILIDDDDQVVYKPVSIIRDKHENEYIDNSLEEGCKVRYMVSATDIYGNISDFSEIVEIQVGNDEEEPVVLSVDIQCNTGSGISYTDPSTQGGTLIPRVGDSAVVIVSVSDNMAVKDVFLSYKDAEEGKVWKDIQVKDFELIYDEEASEGSIKKYYKYRAEIETANLPEGEFFINVKAVDTSGNITSKDTTKRFSVIHTFIDDIWIISAAVSTTMVELQWSDIYDGEFDHFVVEMAEGEPQDINPASNSDDSEDENDSDNLENEGETYDTFEIIDDADSLNLTWKEVGSTTYLGYLITDLKPAHSYYFRVYGVDDVGNKGEYSEVVKLATIVDEYGPVVNAVYPVQGYVSDEIELGMAAEDDTGLAYFLWSYSLDGKDYKTIASKTANGKTSYEGYEKVNISNPDSFPEGELFIKHEAFDINGNPNQKLSDGSDIVTKYIIDRTAPEAPQNVKAEAGQGYINITWDTYFGTASDDEESNDDENKTDNTDDNSISGKTSDIAGYRVYRAEAGSTRYKKIKEGEIKNCVDTNVEIGKSYIYKVTAVDPAGNESPSSEEVYCSAAPDNEAPVILKVTPEEGGTVGEKAAINIWAYDNVKLKDIKVFVGKPSSGVFYPAEERSCEASEIHGTITVDMSGEDEGDYIFRIIATDIYGNTVKTEKLYRLDKTPPSGRLDIENGHFCVKLKMSHFQNLISDESDKQDFSYYEVYRCSLNECSKIDDFKDKAKCIAASLEDEYIDEDVTPHMTYRYAVKIYDKCGNYSWSEIRSGVADSIDVEAPEAILPEKITGLDNEKIMFDGSLCHDNVHISSYVWDMGDGTEDLTGLRPEHAYSKPGRYIVKLTVTDASGNSKTTSTEVDIKSSETSGLCEVQVVDASNRPIAYANVYIDADSDKSTCFIADHEGRVALAFDKGTYKIAAFKEGYLPAETEVTLTPFKKSSTKIRLMSGDVVVGKLSVERMTLQEMIDAGVDISDPENLNVFKFQTTLIFAEEPMPVEVKYTGGDLTIIPGKDVISGGFSSEEGENDNDDGGGRFDSRGGETKLIVTMASPECPVLVKMSTTQQVSWLKDMFSAELNIFNAADNQFVLDSSEAVIKLPEGLSLAKTVYGQSEKVDMGSIAGQENASASWVIKGDASGTYTVEAEYNGTLLPFNEKITKIFTAEKDVKVDPANVKIVVMPESAGYIGELYYIQYAITNYGDEPLYNFKTSIGDYTIPAEVDITLIHNDETDKNELQSREVNGFDYTLPLSSQLIQMPVLSGGGTVNIPVLMPGQTIYGSWKTGFSGPGEQYEVYYRLIDKIVEVIEGQNLGVSVDVEPIGSHISCAVRKKVKLENETVKLGDPVDMATGAFGESYSTAQLSGRDMLGLQLTYDSMIADGCDDSEIYPEGAGWQTNFDAYVTEDDGLVHLHLDPYISMPFITTDAFNGVYRGTYVEEDENSRANNTDKSVSGETQDVSEQSEESENKSDSEEDENKNDEEDTNKKNINIILDEEDLERDIEFTCIYHGMEDFRLVRHSDGSYTLLSDDGDRNEFDAEGRLSAIINADGSKTLISYTGNDMIITEEVSGDFIKLHYEKTSHRLTSVEDGAGGKTYFGYENGNLTEITDTLENTLYFEYDDEHHITAERNSDKELFISNEYDAAGRVIKQTDSYGKVITFEYFDESGMNVNQNVAEESEQLEDKTEKPDNVNVHSDSSDTVRKIKATTISEGYEPSVMITEVDPQGKITSITYPTGITESMTYDDEGRLSTRTDGYGNASTIIYDEATGYVKEVEGVEGSSLSVDYDETGNVKSISDNSIDADTTGSSVSAGDAQYEYYDDGSLKSSTIDGKKTVFTYTEEGLLASEEKVGRGTKSYTYENGRKVSSTDELGNTTVYTYDERGNISSVSDSAGNGFSYLYDEQNRKISETDPNGNTTTYSYNSYGKVTEEHYPDGTCTYYVYNTAGDVTRITYANGAYEEYFYDAAGNMTRAEYPDGSYCTYGYDSLGRNTYVEYPDGTRESYTYDSHGNVTEKTDRKGNTISYKFDESCGRPVGVTDCYGNELQIGYEDGRVETITSPIVGISEYSYRNDDMVEAVTDALGNKTIYDYDGWGNLISVRDSMGYVTEFKYDAAGNCTEKKTADGTAFSYSYDQNYNITAVTSTVSGRKVTEKYEYDGCGNVIKYTDVMGRDTLYTYDSMNRVKTETGFDGTSVEYFYDDMGNVEEERYSNGSSVTYKYDICGRCTEVTEIGRKTGGDATDTTTNNSSDIKKKIYTYTYDNMGRLSTVTDTTGKVTSQTYDSLDNVTSVTDAMGGVTKYTYDSQSRLISVENAIGAIERYDYYDNGNLKKTINSRGQETLYTYDAAGRVTSFTDELGTVSYTYDKNGNVLTIIEVKKKTASDEVDKTIESDNTNTITRTYDCMNRVTSVTDSCGKTIGYGYDEVGNILYVDYPGGERVRYTYNIDGTLYEVTDTEGNRTVYEYDSNSRLSKITRPDGSVEERSYDKAGNLVSTVEKTSGGMLLQSYEYGYDEFGNITSIKDNTEKQDISYTAEADGLGAAVEEEKIEATSENDGAGKAGNNSSDNTGNTSGDTNNNSSQDIITTTATTMEYNEANQLIKYNGFDVLYDSDGNMIYGPLNGEMTRFTYDCRNRLISAGEVSYSYDAENIRTTVENENYIEQYVTDRVSSLSRVLQIIRTDKTNNKNGSETTHYVYGLGLIYENGASENTSRNNNSSDKPNTQYSKNTAESDRLLIYHFDHLGSTRKITDRKGRLLYSFSYGTYGELLSIRSGEKSEKELILAELQSEKPIYFLYNGMLGVMTDENGLYYMRQRYYDTDIKRFINQDILVGSIDNSKSLNRYAYVQGNPVNYNDPFGLNPLDILKPYANLMHGFLNIAGVLPGPLGYVADLMNAGVYFLEGNYKAAASMLIQSFNTFATGRIIGNLSRGSSKGRLLTSIFLAGTGATGIVSSGDNFLENAVGLVYSIANNKDADTVFSYLSGTICSAAGVYYGVKSFVGGYTMGSYALEGLEQEKLQKLHNTMLVERIFCYNSQCFVAGTLIKTPDGDKNIENISPGDKVYAYDAATGDIAEKEVVRTFEHEVYELYHVVIDGKEIVTTAEHPFYKVDKISENGNGFVCAKDLKPGDQILLLEGITGKVEEVFKEELTEPVKVYNFEVKDYHTYFVGEQGVLVHNSCDGGSKSNILLIETSKYISGKTAHHHIIPKFRGKSKPYADFIAERGIDVDQYTITVSSGKGGMHMNSIHGKGDWNTLWMEWIDNHQDATAKDIFQFAGKMMDDFGLSGYKIHPFHKGGK